MWSQPSRCTGGPESPKPLIGNRLVEAAAGSRPWVSDGGLPTKFFPPGFDINHNNAMQNQSRAPRWGGAGVRVAGRRGAVGRLLLRGGHPAARPVPRAHACLSKGKPHVLYHECADASQCVVGAQQVGGRGAGGW